MLRGLLAFAFLLLPGLAGCAGDPGQSGQRWRVDRAGEPQAAPRRRSVALLAAQSGQEILTALDRTMSRIYAGKGVSAYLAAYALRNTGQAMVLLPDDPEVETGGFRPDSAWEECIAGLRIAFRRKYGLGQ